jgi:hypothetical protein
MDSTGYTGPAHKLKCARAPSVTNAWGYPEGFILDRLYLCARQAFAKHWATGPLTILGLHAERS